MRKKYVIAGQPHPCEKRVCHSGPALAMRKTMSCEKSCHWGKRVFNYILAMPYERLCHAKNKACEKSCHGLRGPCEKKIMSWQLAGMPCEKKSCHGNWPPAVLADCHDMIFFWTKNHGNMIFRIEPDALARATASYYEQAARHPP